jgi:spoIIIJ-associated protein
MMTSADKSVEIHGRNIETAIDNGLEELGLRRDQVDIEVLHPGSRGVLGIGAEDAIVRLTPRLQLPTVDGERIRRVEEEIAEEVAAEEIVVVEEAAEPEEAVAVAPEAATEEVGSEETAALAQNLLSDLLDHLGVQAQVVVRYGAAEEGEEPPLTLDVVGKDLGILIGRRGETLASLQFLMRLMVNNSLQFLMRLMVNNHIHRWINLVVDVEGYKARRERMLRELALRMAERAVATGRVVALEAMPARERRLVHIALRDHPDVTTQSIGEGESRKVTIIPR